MATVKPKRATENGTPPPSDLSGKVTQLVYKNIPGSNFMFTWHDRFTVFDLIIFLDFFYLLNVTHFFTQPSCQGDISERFTVEEDELS